MVQHGVGVVARALFRVPGSGLGSSLVWMLLHVPVPVIRVKGVLLHGVGVVSRDPFRFQFPAWCSAWCGCCCLCPLSGFQVQDWGPAWKCAGPAWCGCDNMEWMLMHVLLTKISIQHGVIL
jgi:hypothetical protein